ncbi:MAG: hypothetical protein Q8Q30_00290 [Candidatus Woesebacteria bacterium]|nr:hypothetical protein [Candidatus Woesebacteria bacterium]
MRHIINFFITGAIVWLFQAIGWISITQTMSVFDANWANQLLVAGVVGFIFTVGLWLADLVFAFVVIGSCGIGCFLYPVYLAVLGPVGFWAIGKLLPGWMTLNVNNIWQVILMGVVVSIVRIHAKRSSSSSSSSSS